METTLIFHEGLELPEFAAFPLLEHEEGTRALRDYYAPYLDIARRMGTGFVLEAPTWRANPDWAEKLGYSPGRLDALNRRAIALLEDVRARAEAAGQPIVISGCIGPQGDGYSPATRMSAADAQAYHATQIASFRATAADMVAALTMTYPEEAVGVARAAEEAGMPSAISFTVETDGRLPSGHALGEAIEHVDAETGAAPAYYMINCAHPTHFADVVEEAGPWRDRIRGLRANASARSHAELDEATELDAGDPADLGARHAALRGALPDLRVLGGCCGTDHRHVAEIAGAWLAGGVR